MEPVSSMAAEFSNPIIPGFAPDPSVVLVGETFFLVTSSFHLFPGLPIYSSRDLQTWEHIGNAINRPDQIDLANATTSILPLDSGHTMIAAAGLWAPTIRHHKDVFYIICTYSFAPANSDTLNFYISSTDIYFGRWSDPIFFEFRGIDPSLFFDDDDRSYVQGSWTLTRLEQPSCTIKQFEIDIKTGRALSEIKEIWTGYAKQDSEGPHIYKKDGFYYLLIAEGGTFEHHMLSIARAQNIWGPYESYENNPVMTADGKDEYIQNTGHGELFQDRDGQWWAAVLGIRNNGGRSPLGRETFLTTVSWPMGEWPRIDHPKISFQRNVAASMSSGRMQQVHKPPQRQDLVYIRNAKLEDYKYSSDIGRVAMVARSGELSSPIGTVSFVGKRQRGLGSVAVATSTLDASQYGRDLGTGLVLFKDEHRHAEIMFDYCRSEIVLSVYNSVSGGARETRRPLSASGEISFRIRATKEKYTFEFRMMLDKTWTTMGSIDALEMTARDFTGTILGIFACGKNEAEGTIVVFDNFDVA